MSNVLILRGVDNTPLHGMTSADLNAALAEGKEVIVQVPAGLGFHFLIVDSTTIVNGATYYMTRDPSSGPRGVLSKVLDAAVAKSGNAIVIHD